MTFTAVAIYNRVVTPEEIGRTVAAVMPTVPRAEWVQDGTGDCSGFDIGETSGLVPDPAYCSPSGPYLTAICVDFRGSCLYKSVAPCTGGGIIGKRYYCTDVTP